MSTDNSYPGLPVTTLESIVKEDVAHPSESSGTRTLANPKVPEAQTLSAPTLDCNNAEEDDGHPLVSSETDALANPAALEGEPLSASTSTSNNVKEDDDNLLESSETDALASPEAAEAQPLISASTADWNNTKEDDNHRLESSKIDALASPTAKPQTLSAPTLDWKSLTMPVGMFVAGATFAFGHHAFNALVDRRPVAKVVVPQDWVTRIGVGFSFGFQMVVGITMGFVLLQCLWLSVLRKPLTVRELDTIYQVERQADLYKTLPQALFISPILVFFSVLTLLLPLSGVFAPGSLTVVTQNYTDISGPCTVPTGDLSAPNTTDSSALSIIGGVGYWQTVTPRATKLTTEWFVNQRIPDLPQACGPNCRYKVSVPSFVFQCTPNPTSLPSDQAGIPPIDPETPREITLWNGTTDSTSKWAFYIAWTSHSESSNGTSGNAYCSPVQAQYDVEVQTKNGIQSVTTNVTQTTSPIPDVTNGTFVVDSIPGGKVGLWMQLASLSYATQALFLGSSVLKFGMSATFVEDNTQASQASFLDIPAPSLFGDPEYVWGEVLKGVEKMSHNVTAAILSLHLGTMNSECFFDQQIVVYQYISSALWAPYGAALCVALVSLGVVVIIMARSNTGSITTSFSDTILLTRHLQEDISAGARLRLRVEKGNDCGYILE